MRDLFLYYKRGALVLSVIFLMFLFATTSCTKRRNALGQGALPDGTAMSSDGVDTFSIKSFSFEVDTVISTNPLFNLLGVYNDPMVGNVKAGFYTQISLSGFQPDFGDFDNLKMDSVVAAFRFGGFYGDPSQHLFEVYELDESLDPDSVYYYFSTKATKPLNLVPMANNEGWIKPSPLEQAVVGNDTVAPQLRIPMDTTFGRKLLEYASESSSNDDFFDLCKGLYFTVNTPQPPKGKGSVFYLESTNPNSKVTAYFTIDDTVNIEFDFLITSQLVDFNAMEFDHSNSPIEQVFQDTISGQETYFMQSFKARAKIEFPGISNLDENVVIHQARLELPVSYFSGSNAYPSSSITVGARYFENSDAVFLLNTGSQGIIEFNQQLRAYVIDLRDYVQNVVNRTYINDGIILSPRLFNTTAERTVLNGPLTKNKMKPKLNIVYTQF